MLYRFTGQYTNGSTAINACGIVFHGREPADVTDAEALRRLANHPEFEAVEDVPDLAVVVPVKRRTRKPAK